MVEKIISVYDEGNILECIHMDLRSVLTLSFQNTKYENS